MEVEAEEQPKVHHRKMGPKGTKQDVQVQDDAMVDVFVDNGRCLNLLERRAHIPLSIQRMMASGPINGQEIAYYPWNVGKRNEARPKEQAREQEQAVRGKNREQRKSQEQRARKEQNQMQERKGSEAAGIVNL